jgi:hypothetical protein
MMFGLAFGFGVSKNSCCFLTFGVANVVNLSLLLPGTIIDT